MYWRVHFRLIILCVLFIYVYTSDAIPCDSCGNECANACGTKHFRTCCFNYLRKRADPNIMKSISNKRLIDFIMLQGHAMYSLNDLSRQHDEQMLKEAAIAAAAAAAAATTGSDNVHNLPSFKDIVHETGTRVASAYYT